MRRFLKIIGILLLAVTAYLAADYYFDFQPYLVKASPTPVSGSATYNPDCWLSTWGGEDMITGCGNCGNWYDTCNDVTVDDAGFIYVTGRSMEKSYPGSTGIAYLTKFDSTANMIWRHQWAGGSGMGQEIEYDPEGSIIVTGTYAGTVDLDPGPDTVEFTAVEGNDLFLIKFNLDGDYIWGVSWGGHDGGDALNQDSTTALAIDSSGDVFVAGGFYGACDFDPYLGIALHTSTMEQNDDAPFPYHIQDNYLTSFTHDGRFRWVRKWGNESGWNTFNDIAVDDEDSLYLTGSFRSEMDFDPGDGRHIATPVGGHDAFVLKMDADGNFKWVRIWGGSIEDSANGAAFRNGLLYVAGDFGAEAQFDPGPGTLFKSSNGSRDSSLSVFDPNGVFQWVRTWGGEDSDYWERDSASDVVVTDDGKLCISGVFPKDVDFSGGQGEIISARGALDTYVMVMDESGGFEDVFTWGGEGNTSDTSLLCDQHGNLYITGTYENSFTFESGDLVLSANQHSPSSEYGTSSSDSFLLKINIDNVN